MFNFGDPRDPGQAPRYLGGRRCASEDGRDKAGADILLSNHTA